MRGLGFGPRRHHFPALAQCGGPFSWRQYPDVLQHHRRQVQQWAGTEEQSTRFMCRVHGVDNALMCANAGLSPPTFSHSRVLLLLSHSPTHLAGFVLVLVCSLPLFFSPFNTTRSYRLQSIYTVRTSLACEPVPRFTRIIRLALRSHADVSTVLVNDRRSFFLSTPPAPLTSPAHPRPLLPPHSPHPLKHHPSSARSVCPTQSTARAASSVAPTATRSQGGGRPICAVSGRSRR